MGLVGQAKDGSIRQGRFIDRLQCVSDTSEFMSVIAKSRLHRKINVQYWHQTKVDLAHKHFVIEDS